MKPRCGHLFVAICLLPLCAWAGNPFEDLFPPASTTTSTTTTTTSTTTTTTTIPPTVPVKPIPTGSYPFDSQKEFTADSTFPAYTLGPKTLMQILVLFKPTLIFKETYSGIVNYYIGYLKHGILYLAREEINGKVVWDKYRTGDPLTLYRTGSFMTKWTCDALIRAGTIVDFAAGLEFYFGVQSITDPSLLQGCRFTFEWPAKGAE